MSQHTLLPLSSSVRPLLVVYLHLFNMYTYGTQVCSSSVSGGSSGPRDVLWERALASLPEPLLRGLRDADLGSATTLQNYPRMEGHVLEEMLDWGGAGAGGTASSDAASSSNSCTTYGHEVQAQVLEWCVVKEGGDPKTDQEASVDDKGGDPRTDRASSKDESVLCREMAATCPPYRPGAVAPQTAMSSASASAVLASVDDEHPDEFPSESPVLRDGLPGLASMKGEANPDGSSLLDRILQRRFSTGILRDFHTGESSESLRQSQLDQVQIVPATLIPSELSAHQMAARSDGSLAQPRADGRPVSALSLQDKVLLRKYSIPVSTDMTITAAEKSLVQSERDGLTIRSEGLQRAEDMSCMDQTYSTVFDSTAQGSSIPLVQIPFFCLKGLGASRIRWRQILRGDEESERLVSRRNRERIAELFRIGRMRSPRLLRGLRIFRWIREIAPSFEGVMLQTWFYCTLHWLRTERSRRDSLPSF